jgi:superfamily II DNA or RNA helicase
MGGFYSRVGEHVALLGDRDHGWRHPQLGALGATLAHWSLAEREPTVISIPTGTGKTAVGMAAPFLTPTPPGRVLVLAPARQIRRQLVEQFSTYRQLHRLGVLPEGTGAPEVFEMSGRAADWSQLEGFDVVVALPNSISPAHYEDSQLPPRNLFDLIVVDEAHHAPADTWRAVIDHFAEGRALLLTATPRRRDGQRIPGSLQYYYPLRRALEEGLYKPIQPVLLTAPVRTNRGQSDAAIAAQAADFLGSAEHRTSTLLVRGATVARLRELRDVYESAGIDLALLHNAMSERKQREVVDGLRAGSTRAVGVVGMLSEGFDLPSLRLVAYHDKHRSLPATVQLIGRLARVDDAFPQPSSLIAVADADVFPELKGVLRQLYDEDADWAEVLPGIIDADIQRERLDREFAERLPPSRTEVDPTHLKPTKRAFVYEVPPDWEPPFLDELPPELEEGAPFVGGGSVLYAGADPDARLLVIVIRYIDRPKWSSDPALANVVYELHVVAHRKPPQVTLPGLVLLNLDRDGLRRTFESILGLDGVAQLAGPQRIGGYLDSLERISVSSVGVRSTNAATRGRATYRNFMGSSVDRGLRTVDMARSALGHVMFQVNTSDGAANAGGAVEKSKLWLTRYGQLRELSQWVDTTAALLWFPQQAAQGPLLPGMDRGHRLEDWPEAPPLSAELYPGLYGIGLELWEDGTRLGGIEDLDLYVNDDPTGTLQDVESPRDGPLRIIGVLNDREHGRALCVWEATVDTAGHFTASRDLAVRRGYGDIDSLAALLESQPPTIYFLDGTTTIGPVRYDSRTLTSAFDSRLLTALDWSNADITAETRRTADTRGGGDVSVHDHLAEYLRSRPRLGLSRWIIYNDGPGEIADYLVVEELATGEIQLGLWHAKASNGATPGVRVKDFQEVVAQALRSRRQFPSTTLWSELGARLSSQARPVASIVDGSDDPVMLNRRLGLTDGDSSEPPWTQRYPAVRGTLGIVQPGLSAEAFRAELSGSPVPPGAQSLRELFSVMADMAQSDGAELVLVVSP